jgi:hypothetical protein
MKPTSKEWKPMEEDQDGGIDTFLEEYELNDNPTALTLRRLLGEAFSSKDAQKYNGARVALNRVANLWIGDEDEDDDDEPAMEQPSDTAKEIGAPMAPNVLPRR